MTLLSNDANSLPLEISRKILSPFGTTESGLPAYETRDFVTVWRQICKRMHLRLHLLHADKRTKEACHTLSIIAATIPSVSMQDRGVRCRNGNHR